MPDAADFCERGTRISANVPSWSWGESNPRPPVRERTRYDHSRIAPNAGALAGQPILRSAPELSRESAVFLAVSGLSRRHPSLLLPGCDGLAPCGISAHDDSSLTWNQAARVNCSSAILWVAPFNESEQLGSQTRPTVLMSKPVSPVNDMSAAQCTTGERRSHVRFGRRHAVRRSSVVDGRG